MTIRKYELEDYKELSEMILALYDEDPEGESITQGKIIRTTEVFSELPSKGSIWIFEEEVVCGYGILAYQWSNEYGTDIVHIDELYVKPQMRGKGIGTSFIKKIIEDKENEVISLEVTPSNMRAMEYYKELGFVSDINTHLSFINI